MAWKVIHEARVVKCDETGRVGVITAPGGEVREIAFIESLTAAEYAALENKTADYYFITEETTS